MTEFGQSWPACLQTSLHPSASTSPHSEGFFPLWPLFYFTGCKLLQGLLVFEAIPHPETQSWNWAQFSPKGYQKQCKQLFITSFAAELADSFLTANECLKLFSGNLHGSLQGHESFQREKISCLEMPHASDLSCSIGFLLLIDSGTSSSGKELPFVTSIIKEVRGKRSSRAHFISNTKKDFAINQEKLEHVIEYYGRSNMPYEGVNTIWWEESMQLLSWVCSRWLTDSIGREEIEQSLCKKASQICISLGFCK